MPPSNDSPDTLTGTLERIVFANEENHYTIGEFRPNGGGQPVTIAGNLPGVQCGETLELHGEWQRHPVHGPQFKIKGFTSKLPSTVHGIRKYLGSGMIPNIGPKFAEKIVNHFGVDTLKVISEESGRLREVPGVGKQRAKDIKLAWESQQAQREIMLFLHTYGVSTALCTRIYRRFGNEARTILERDPFRVARDIQGIGFKTADQIARNLGLQNDNPRRLEAGLIFALEEAESEGHTAFTSPGLIEQAARLLDVEAALLDKPLKSLVEQGALVPSGDAATDAALLFSPGTILQLPASHRAEIVVAHALRDLLDTPSCLPPIIIDKAVEWAQERAGFAFAPEQGEAISAAIAHKVSILTGGPGTGKTTILHALVDILKAKRVRLLLAAPTGRAAQRMGETTGAPAQTIHRLLKFDPAAGGFSVNADNPLPADFVIVDETSMLDSKLAACLLRAIPSRAHLLLVGDADQLPSVGAGNVLGDLIGLAGPGSGLPHAPAVTRLSQIFRQQSRSRIVLTAHAILHGEAQPPAPVEDPAHLDPSEDLHFIAAPEPELCAEAVVSLCRACIPRWYPHLDPVMDVQVLPPMHKGAGGTHNLNAILQSALNPGQPGVTLGPNRFHRGDKVIQQRNNYDKNLFNGDLGRISHINAEAGTIAVRFDNEVHDFTRGEMTDLALAYAISIHKSQGSEFPVVIIPLLKQHFVMLQRNLLYTAITRGRKKVFLVGDPAAYAMAVRNRESARRLTALREKMEAGA